jgi:hypothetical protein
VRDFESAFGGPIESAEDLGVALGDLHYAGTVMGQMLDSVHLGFMAAKTTAEEFDTAVKELFSSTELSEGELRELKKTLPELGEELDLSDKKIASVAAVIDEKLARNAEAARLRGMEPLAASMSQVAREAGETGEAAIDLGDLLGEAEEAAYSAEEATGTLAERLLQARDAQESLTDAVRAAADPVFAAVDAVGGLRDAQDKLAQLQKDGKEGTDEWNEAQIGLAKAALESQGALDQLSPEKLDAALEAIALALGVTKGEVEGLLRSLGVLDGSEPVVTVRVEAPKIQYTSLPTGEVVAKRIGTNTFAHGAIVRARPGGTAGLFGEAGDDEMVTPLDERGLRFLVEAMRRAGLGGGGGGNTYHFTTRADAVDIAREIAWRERTSGA